MNINNERNFYRKNWKNREKKAEKKLSDDGFSDELDSDE